MLQLSRPCWAQLAGPVQSLADVKQSRRPALHLARERLAPPSPCARRGGKEKPCLAGREVPKLKCSLRCPVPFYLV